MRKQMLIALSAATLTAPMAAMPAFADHDRYQRYEPRYYNGPVWQDDRGYYRCKRTNGTTGMLVGAASGALIGRAIDTRGERATGTIIGAAVGALLGREVEKGLKSKKYRCR
ncbi:glycine zipper 2TM domain-containing protein [Sphingomicrobium flavum]|uniref:glycine zipper 2TM domain-containing protein n=1 Tax=Sphingomicrobium flavum TaxID=1229164 RepID=UPI0021AE26D9|nr:glycine zipper 2TM domain-containing protein [Sphingomicrobium flavum]